MSTYKQIHIDGMKDSMLVDEEILDVLDSIFVFCNIFDSYKFSIQDKIYSDDVRLVIIDFNNPSTLISFKIQFSVSYKKVKKIFLQSNSKQLEDMVIRDLGLSKGGKRNLMIEDKKMIKIILTNLIGNMSLA